MKRKFYLILAMIFPVFFLLHWNGLFSPTYYWALEAVDGTDKRLPQFGFALLSAIVIFAMIAIFYEVITRIAGKSGSSR